MVKSKKPVVSSAAFNKEMEKSIKVINKRLAAVEKTLAKMYAKSAKKDSKKVTK